MRFGPFRYDFRKELLQRGGSDVQVAPIALKALDFVLRNKERLVTYDELIQLIWGDNPVKSAKDLHTSLGGFLDTLSHKGHRFIETVPKRGYRFKPRPLVHAVADDAMSFWRFLLARRYVAFGFLTVLIAICAATWWYRDQHAFKGTVILVADFERQESPYQITRGIIDNLNKAAKQYLDMRVERLPKFISWEQGERVAAMEGQKRHAAIVLWGDCEKTSTHAAITVHFQMIKREPVYIHLLKENSESLVVPLSHLENFVVRQSLSEQMSYLALLAVGVARQAAGDDRGAIKAFDAALGESSAPQDLVDPDVLYSLRARSHFQLGEFDASIADEQRVLTFKPESVEDHANIALAYLAVGNHYGAISESKKAVELAPNLAAPHLNLGLAFSKAGGYEDALSETAKALSLDPQNGYYHNAMGTVLFEAGRVDEAIAEFNKAVTLGFDESVARNNRGFAFLRQKKYACAVIDYRRVITLKPGSANAHNGLGFALYSLGRIDDAIVEYRAGTALDPRAWYAHHDFGMVLSEKGDFYGSIDELKKAIELAPREGGSHLSLGSVLVKVNQYDNAIAEFRKAVALQPNDAESHRSLGILLCERGMTVEGFQELERAVSLAPDSWFTHRDYGDALAHEGQTDKAIDEYEKCIAIASTIGPIHMRLADLLFFKHRYQEAITEYEKAIALGPISNDALRNLALAQEAQSDSRSR